MADSAFQESLDEFILKFDGILERHSVFEIDCETLYHYTPADALKSIIEKKQFWLTESGYMNDLYDTKFAVILIKKLLEDKKYMDVASGIKFIANKADEHKRSFILSFSVKEDDLPMWNYYSKSTGYNLEMRSDVFESILGKEIWDCILFPGEEASDAEIANQMKNKLKEHWYASSFFGKVIYDKETQEAIFKDIFALYRDCLNNDHLKDLCEDLFLFIFRSFFPYIKSKHFEYEGEYRLVITVPDNAPIINISKFLNFRTSNNVIVPYIILDISKLYEESSEAITKITIGPIGKQNPDIKVGLEEFRSSKGYSMEVEESKIDLRYVNYKN